MPEAPENISQWGIILQGSALDHAPNIPIDQNKRAIIEHMHTNVYPRLVEPATQRLIADKDFGLRECMGYVQAAGEFLEDRATTVLLDATTSKSTLSDTQLSEVLNPIALTTDLGGYIQRIVSTVKTKLDEVGHDSPSAKPLQVRLEQYQKALSAYGKLHQGQS